MSSSLGKTRHRERGSAFVEFVLCMSLFWVPFFFGMSVLGFGLVRAMEVTQVCRDAGHMYAYGTDFSQTSAQALLSSLATGMNLSSTGNSFIILSTITYVNQTDCQAAYPSSGNPNCANTGNYVFMKQVKIGNNTLGISGASPYNSVFGTPASNIQDSSGGITPQNYMQNSSALAGNFQTTSGITLASGQVSYIAEMFATPLQPIFWSQFSNPVVSARAYF